MHTNPFSRNFTGMATAVALAAGTLGTPLTQAQTGPQYDTANIQRFDVQPTAAHADRAQPVAPIAAKPNGGAYIQWADAASKVYMTEVDNFGIVVANDVELTGNGQSETAQPGGLAATADSFGYFLKDNHKLTFKVHGAAGNPLVIMDHVAPDETVSYSKPPAAVNDGSIQFPNANKGVWDSNTPYGPWYKPYEPLALGRGDLTFANNQFGTIFGHISTFGPPGPGAAHEGDATLFFDANGGNPSPGKLWGASHSLDQRIAFDASNNSFYTAVIGDANPKDIRLRTFPSQGAPVQNDLFNKPAGVPYNDDLPGKIDEGYEDDEKGGQQYGIGGNALGASSGLLGELHPLGDGRIALTYGITPREWGGIRDRRNQVEIALIDAQGEIMQRKRIHKYPSTAGQGNYTNYRPKERARWIKSAKVGNRILVFWQTETWDGTALDSFGDPDYTVSSVRVVQLDLQGDIVQAPETIPDGIGFNYGDGLQTLSNCSVAWTHTGGNNLRLYLWPDPSGLTRRCPVAGTGTGTDPTPPQPVASQSSTAFFGGAAARATDGNVDGNFGNGSVTHTDFEANPWWQLDLGAESTITNIQVSNRTDCCSERLSNAKVFVSSTPFQSTDLATTEADANVTTYALGDMANKANHTVQVDILGRYIRIQLPGTGYLSLAEVVVQTETDTPPQPVASQSSTAFGGAAGRATDGNTNGNFGNYSVTHTSLEANPWWQLDLGAESTITNIQVSNRTDCCSERLMGAKVFVSQTPFPTDFDPATAPTEATLTDTASQTVTVNKPGRYIRIQLPGTGYLSLAEAIVNRDL